MGCDIHDYVEVRKDDVWEKVGYRFPNPYYDPDKKIFVTVIDGEIDDNDIWNVPAIDSPICTRSYILFSVLAGVRGSYDSIAQPRGLPSDVSKDVRILSDDWGSDGHSHSWVTLRELQEYDWSKLGEEATYLGWFVSNTIPMLEKLGDPDDVRLVFWFDNGILV